MEVILQYDTYEDLTEKAKALEEILQGKAVKIERNWGHFSYYVTNDKEMVESLTREIAELIKAQKKPRRGPWFERIFNPSA